MRFVLFPPVLLFFFASSTFAVQDCELNGESVNPANGHTTAGKTGMMKCRDRDSGQLVREEELRDGKFVGLIRYYRDGRLAREYTVNEKGNRNGRAREFHADGSVAREENYRNGDTVGVSRTWYANGALKRITAYEGGRSIARAEFNDHGQLTDFFCADHPVMGKAFDDTALCGHGAREPVTHEVYSGQGKIVGRVSLRNGRPVWSESFWDNGKIRRSEGYADGGILAAASWVERKYSRDGVKRREIQRTAPPPEGKRILDQEYHESGNLVRETRWQDDVVVQERTWYLNGQPKSDCHYSRRGEIVVGEETDYYDNGKPRWQGKFQKNLRGFDRPIGTVRHFDTEGRLRKESEYDAEGRLTRERQFDAGGTVVRDDAVFEDGSRKAFSAPD